MLARGGLSAISLINSSSWAVAGLPVCQALGQLLQRQSTSRSYAEKAKQGNQWHWMVSQGHKINPCNSMLHPAVKEAGIMPEGSEEVPVQIAYTPKSHCFGCGPSHPDGLHLESKRIDNGLEAHITLPSKYCAFPGILNGGVLSTLLDCHGNWTSAIALMDRSCLPKPPLTLTASMLVSYKEPSPPDTELIVRSQVVAVRENQNPGIGKAAVEVDVAILLPQMDGSEKLLVQGTGIFKRLGRCGRCSGYGQYKLPGGVECCWQCDIAACKGCHHSAGGLLYDGIHNLCDRITRQWCWIDRAPDGLVVEFPI